MQPSARLTRPAASPRRAGLADWSTMSAVLCAVPSFWVAIALSQPALGATQEPAAAESKAQVTVEPTWDVETWLRPDEPFGVRVVGTSPRDTANDRIAIFLAETDRTDFFRRQGDVWIHRSEIAPLPRGEMEVVVWRVDPAAGWQEIGRLPLRVLRRGGLERFDRSVRLDLEGTGDVDSGGDPEAPFETDARGTGQFNATLGVSRGGWSMDGSMNVVGVSQLQEALRFAGEGEDAPRVDLSAYRLDVSRPLGSGSLTASVGHVDFGTSRQLMSSFAARGITLLLPLGRIDVGLSAQNGTSIVGWDNPLGLDDGEHRVYGGRVGVEMLPQRPGELRLEATVLDGSLRPESDFNQGVISDAETSDGWSLRLVAASAGGRLRLDGAWAESRFDNPFDPLLAQGADLVAVEKETRNARYVDLDLALVNGRTFGTAEHLLDLRLALRHELVEPQYRSVGAFVGADVESYRAELNSTLGPVAALLSWMRSEDNLDDIPSILTTRTEQAAGNVALPLADVFGGTSPAWPSFSWSTQRTHQRGLGVPVNSGFSASHVPDQVSWSHDGGFDWSGGSWMFGLRYSGSHQDNRQPGREENDFITEVYSVNASFALHPRLDLGVDLSHERAVNQAAEEVTETDNRGLNFSWRAHDRLQLTGTVSLTDSETDPTGLSSDDVIGDLQAVWRFAWALGGGAVAGSGHGMNGQVYLRYAYSRNESFDPFFDAEDFRRTWRLSTGINLSFF